jgi:hypothetical protein
MHKDSTHHRRDAEEPQLTNPPGTDILTDPVNSPQTTIHARSREPPMLPEPDNNIEPTTESLPNPTSPAPPQNNAPAQVEEPTTAFSIQPTDEVEFPKLPSPARQTENKTTQGEHSTPPPNFIWRSKIIEAHQDSQKECGNPQTPKVPDWRVFVPNPDISG